MVSARFKYKIQNADGIDTLQLKVPFALLCLLLNGEGTVEDAPVLEIFLIRLLHLNEDLLSFLILAVNVKDSLAVRCRLPEMLAVKIFQVLNHLLAVKEGIEETDQQFLVDLRSKQFLEYEIRVEIYISLLQSRCTHIICPFIR